MMRDEEKTDSAFLRAAAFAVLVLLVGGLAWWAAGKGGAASRTGAAVSAPLPKLILLDEGGCLGCMLKKGLLAELAAVYPERLRLEYVNVKIERKKTERCGIRKVPAQIGFDAAGRELFRHEGPLSAAEVAVKFKESGIDLSPAPAAMPPKPTPPDGTKGL
jgi:thioredoxin 1